MFQAEITYWKPDDVKKSYRDKEATAVIQINGLSGNTW